MNCECKWTAYSIKALAGIIKSRSSNSTCRGFAVIALKRQVEGTERRVPFVSSRLSCVRKELHAATPFRCRRYHVMLLVRTDLSACLFTLFFSLMTPMYFTALECMLVRAVERSTSVAEQCTFDDCLVTTSPTLLGEAATGSARRLCASVVSPHSHVGVVRF